MTQLFLLTVALIVNNVKAEAPRQVIQIDRKPAAATGLVECFGQITVPESNFSAALDLIRNTYTIRGVAPSTFEKGDSRLSGAQITISQVSSVCPTYAD